nr:RING-H2 finger protein ATL47 [Ipomoea batatas]
MDELFLYMLTPELSEPLPCSFVRGKSYYLGCSFFMQLVFTSLVRTNLIFSSILYVLQVSADAVILPSLLRLHGNSSGRDACQDEGHGSNIIVSNTKNVQEKRKHCDVDLEREDECGICLEPCTKMVLPNCCHAMCINCYRDWNVRSESCPFCRGSLKRVESGDLWVLTCNGDVVDQETVSKDDMVRFHGYINSLPKDVPDALFLVYYEYLI